VQGRLNIELFGYFEPFSIYLSSVKPIDQSELSLQCKHRLSISSVSLNALQPGE